ncbi:hypothetical protein BJ956_002532 [Arthrobacter psychrochitiniphilus]|nr:hypothetical protein [Arthrobacter psychrochitiniphilus]
MNGLKTEFQIQFGSRNRANERGAKIFRHRYTLFELPHTAWAAPKLPYTNGEGRAMAGLGAQRGFANENSCKNI